MLCDMTLLFELVLHYSDILYIYLIKYPQECEHTTRLKRKRKINAQKNLSYLFIF